MRDGHAGGASAGTGRAGDPDLRVSLCGLEWKNPVGAASGTFSARESGLAYDFSQLGAVTVKGLSKEPWQGNPTPRIAECPSGMLNAIGLENKGAGRFVAEDLPFLRAFIGDSGTRVIANVAGHSVGDCCEAAEALDCDGVDMLELNISCPNVEMGGMGFGTDPRMAAEVTGAVRARVKRPLIVKLTPNVTDIAEIARAVEAAGADAVSLINTLLGMRIDLGRRRPALANITGGLSGPAIRPVAVRMVYQVSRAVKIPVIGMGGIMSGEDAAEFLMAGASAVEVGTAALIDPSAPLDILKGLSAFMSENGFGSVAALRAALGTGQK
ncbi:MAG: dihydroorotate dehydrogenase [Clostridiales Family XIII bacterium]|jgi:dihydroorotate dehydrogenase (NAD+) catalytic subunit|nr:dihydroorotate dehydrogenase [Clostridiales Family XIII bacterium]